MHIFKELEEVKNLQFFDNVGVSDVSSEKKVYTLISTPPTKFELKRNNTTNTQITSNQVGTSQLILPTLKNPQGYLYSQIKNNPCALLSILSVEVFCSVRGSLLPDPNKDAVLGVFYAFKGVGGENLIMNGIRDG